MSAVVEIWLESLIPFLQWDSRIVHCIGRKIPPQQCHKCRYDAQEPFPSRMRYNTQDRKNYLVLMFPCDFSVGDILQVSFL